MSRKFRLKPVLRMGKFPVYDCLVAHATGHDSEGLSKQATKVITGVVSW